jgi:ankyrin repeat protein
MYVDRIRGAQMPLHEATRIGQHDIVMALLKAGVDPTQRDDDENTLGDVA